MLQDIIPLDEFFSVQLSPYLLDDRRVQHIAGLMLAEPHTVGKCYNDAIALYEYARKEVAYHEAFHRISEVFLDDSERKRVYDWYKKVWKKSHKGEPTEDDLIEGTADQFMYFMQNNMLIKYNADLSIPENIKNFFKSLWNTIRFFHKIGSVGLYKLYTNIGRGKYKDFKLDDAAKARAEQFEKLNPQGRSYTIGGT